MSKHTEIKLPLKLRFNDEYRLFRIEDSSGHQVCELMQDYETDYTYGTQIVKACNNHERLVEALKRCVLRIELFSAVPFSDESDFLPPIRELLSELEKDGE